MKIYRVKVNGKVYEVELEAVSETAGSITVPTAPVAQAKSAPVSGGTKIVAPIAGKVLSFKVGVGDTVKKGQIVAVVEAMKLENEIPATEEGTVKQIVANVGDLVENQQTLIVLG